MSYASIASHNIPEGEMPKPDQDLLTGHFEGETKVDSSVDHKINILPAGSDPEHPDVHIGSHTEPISVDLHPAPEPEPSTSEAAPKPLPTPERSSVKLPESGAEFEKAEKEKKRKEEETKKKAAETAKKAEKKTEEVADKAEKKASELGNEAADKANELGDKAAATANELGDKAKQTANEAGKKLNEVEKAAEKKGKEISKKAQAEINRAESALGPYWEKTKDVVLRPGTLGGLMGVVNVGILGTLGYFAYTRRDQPWDRRIVGGAVAGTLALFGAEGYVTESYLQTPEGRQEAERAKAEGSRFYVQAREVILRPQIAGGLVGAVNVAILGAVGYLSYKNWNQTWDNRTVSAVAIGLIGLSGLEGYAGKAYVDKELPKH
ncbi:hypothetical protein IAU60_005596 [Kwoniella sp. DSM 27419]